MILKKIREVLDDASLDMADKLCEIEKLLPKKQHPATGETFAEKYEASKESKKLIFDAGTRWTYIDNPRLENEDDLYYDGSGCTWGTDLDGKRYWKRYGFHITPDRPIRNKYEDLSTGDIINEKARIKQIVIECLNEI